MYMLEGISSVAGFTAYEESQWGCGSHLLICSVFFVSKGNLFLTFIVIECELSSVDYSQKMSSTIF